MTADVAFHTCMNCLSKHPEDEMWAGQTSGDDTVYWYCKDSKACKRRGDRQAASLKDQARADREWFPEDGDADEDMLNDVGEVVD